MFDKFIQKYGEIQNQQTIDAESLAKIKNLLPEELFTFISKGAGSYMDDFFWTVNPIEYNNLLEEVYTPVQQPSICFARDAFMGLYVWEDNSIVYIDVRHGTSKIVGRRLDIFFNSIMTDWEYFSDELHLSNYQPAKDKLGKVSYDEGYGYVPLLGLGGAEKAENLEKVKIKEHLSLIAQALGKID